MLPSAGDDQGDWSRPERTAALAMLAGCDDVLDRCRRGANSPGGSADRDRFRDLFRERLDAEGRARGRDCHYMSADMSPDDA